MLPLEFVVFGIPISAQAKHGSPSKKRWMLKVATEAQIALPTGVDPARDDVLVQIVYYYTGAPLDVDNMLKPILDAMNGIVYADDGQVADIRAAKRDLSGSFHAASAPQRLADALKGGTDFVHVRVEGAPNPRDIL